MSLFLWIFSGWRMKTAESSGPAAGPQLRRSTPLTRTLLLMENPVWRVISEDVETTTLPETVRHFLTQGHLSSFHFYTTAPSTSGR